MMHVYDPYDDFVVALLSILIPIVMGVAVVHDLLPGVWNRGAHLVRKVWGFYASLFR